MKLSLALLNEDNVFQFGLVLPSVWWFYSFVQLGTLPFPYIYIVGLPTVDWMRSFGSVVEPYKKACWIRAPCSHPFSCHSDKVSTVSTYCCHPPWVTSPLVCFVQISTYICVYLVGIAVVSSGL